MQEVQEFTEDPYYVSRGEVERHLSALVGTSSPYKFFILSGPAGSGKSYVLKHVLNKKRGVIITDTDETTTVAGPKRKLLRAVDIPQAQFAIGRSKAKNH